MGRRSRGGVGRPDRGRRDDDRSAAMDRGGGRGIGRGDGLGASGALADGRRAEAPGPVEPASGLRLARARLAVSRRRATGSADRRGRVARVRGGGAVHPGRRDECARDLAARVAAPPAPTPQLLPEWGASLGLPDACTGPAVGLAERRKRVVSKLVDTGGQSRTYYIALAAALGFPGCTITEYAAFSVGSGCDASLNTADTGWPHAWRFNVPVQAGAVSFNATSGCDEALRGWGSATLECVIRRAAPAHTAVLFGYRADEDWLRDGGDAEDWGLLDQIGSQPEVVEDWGALA
ncbi:DUF2313 domain-containing protein [Azospirillum brasilense]|nr:DUF2313 domain-containing protein [Azospirillum brasilense]